MNILEKNKSFHTIFIFLFCVVPIFAEDNNAIKKDSTFAFAIEAGGGFTENLDYASLRMRFSPLLRMYWRPNHLLDLGIEASYIHIKSDQKSAVMSEFGETDFRASLTGWPLILTYRMSKWNLALTGGIGAAYINSTIDAFNKEVSVNFWYYCYYFSLGYTYNLSEKINLGVEFSSYSLPRIEQNLVGINFKVAYDLFRW